MMEKEMLHASGKKDTFFLLIMVSMHTSIIDLVLRQKLVSNMVFN